MNVCGDVGCWSVRQWCEVEEQSEVERFQRLKVAHVFDSDRQRTLACQRARGSTGSELQRFLGLSSSVLHPAEGQHTVKRPPIVRESSNGLRTRHLLPGGLSGPGVTTQLGLPVLSGSNLTTRCDAVFFFWNFRTPIRHGLLNTCSDGPAENDQVHCDAGSRTGRFRPSISVWFMMEAHSRILYFHRR